MPQHEKYISTSREFLAKAMKHWSKTTCLRRQKRDGALPPRWLRPSLSKKGGNTMVMPTFSRLVRQLADETWDNQLVRLFQIANSLHINFYENWIPKESVRESLVAVQEFVEKTEGLLR
jgi:hypothetical protein